MFTTHTRPRAIAVRWARRHDQIALYRARVSLYHGSAPSDLSPVRTAEYAASAPLTIRLVWATIVDMPRLVHADGADGYSGVHEFSVQVPGVVLDVPMRIGDEEQIVIRERIDLEPWDVVAEGHPTPTSGGSTAPTAPVTGPLTDAAAASLIRDGWVTPDLRMARGGVAITRRAITATPHQH